ncbi:AraC family transcriptional regulator [Pseudorhodoplanes sinuspersici]|uniref:AraC family transcriptional regulator n=2 Tax=Pseudorhodoplanes sinuspersici TaxID=1235591 RepID=A0A1W7A073_9HYPH|nr:AraC family transcriptional regulator [Pseudorhodoplanes sinuspersici]
MAEAGELAALIDRFSGADGIQPTAIPRLVLIRCSQPTEPLHALHEPALCIVAQGRKQVMLGDTIYDYDPAHYLVVSVDVPIIGQVIEASPSRPYLCLRLDLDPVVLSALILDAGADDATDQLPQSSLQLDVVTLELLDAAIRLVRLLATPRDIGMLAPLAEREILYRLLHTPQGARLRQIARADGKLQQINRAIDWIKKNFRESFSIEQIAAEARMSASALHDHFKTVTAMTPLQYQKQLRLQEARRLMVGLSLDAAAAGHEVGYDSPSQFSREYRRLFGAPPARDVARLRETPGMLAGTLL